MLTNETVGNSEWISTLHWKQTISLHYSQLQWEQVRSWCSLQPRPRKEILLEKRWCNHHTKGATSLLSLTSAGKSGSIPEQQLLPLCTVKRVLYRHNLTGHAARTEPAPKPTQNPHYVLQLSMWTKIRLSEEKSSGHMEQKWNWLSWPLLGLELKEWGSWWHHEEGKWCGSTEAELQNISQEVRSLVTKGPSKQTFIHIPKLWQKGSGTTESRYWSGHHKVLTSIQVEICVGPEKELQSAYNKP